MKLFKCQNCGHVLNFESRECENCHHLVGYLASRADMVAIDGPGHRSYRLCANADFDTCNWLIPGDTDYRYCLACRHNRTIPDLSIAENLAHWRLYEVAKHRLVYSLIDLGLPLHTRAEDPQHGLAFDILAETREKPRVVTGHRNGLITLNLKEADDAYRATERLRLGEPCRTLLGHLRHEIGHFYWDLLIADDRPEEFREVFGDERQDYGAALQSYYANGPARDWKSDYVSAYASSHPWEDFAETWAHYLHMIDTMEMAFWFGARLRPGIDSAPELNMSVGAAPQSLVGFREFIDEWQALTVFMNSINRCMGSADLYPFAISHAMISKLEFVHSLVAPGKASVDAELLTVNA